jgi:hypothetical protein
VETQNQKIVTTNSRVLPPELFRIENLFYLQNKSGKIHNATGWLPTAITPTPLLHLKKPCCTWQTVSPSGDIVSQANSKTPDY